MGRGLRRSAVAGEERGMNGRPVRGGCRWRVLLALAMVPLLTGCLFSDLGDGGSVVVLDMGASSAPPIQPALCGTDPVLSSDVADTAQPLTVAEMQARLLAQPADKPAGYTSQAVVVDEGLGSFRISTPSGYSVFWRNGTPADELFELSTSRDQEWTDFWQGQMETGELNARAIAIDSERTDEVVALLITLTPGMPESGQEMADLFAENYTSGGFRMRETCGVRANGEDGAYVEHIVPAESIDGSVDRTQMQFLIPDKPNDALWGVTCDVVEESAAEVKKVCLEIASTFEPLPPVAP